MAIVCCTSIWFCQIFSSLYNTWTSLSFKMPNFSSQLHSCLQMHSGCSLMLKYHTSSWFWSISDESVCLRSKWKKETDIYEVHLQKEIYSTAADMTIPLLSSGNNQKWHSNHGSTSNKNATLHIQQHLNTQLNRYSVSFFPFSPQY